MKPSVVFLAGEVRFANYASISFLRSLRSQAFLRARVLYARRHDACVVIDNRDIYAGVGVIVGDS